MKMLTIRFWLARFLNKYFKNHIVPQNVIALLPHLISGYDIFICTGISCNVVSN